MPQVAEVSAPEQRLAVALGHPLRVELLRNFIETTTSPVDLAAKLRKGLAHVSYHTTVLLKANCIELVRTEARRGAVAHYYRGIRRPVIDEASWAALSDKERSDISSMVLSNLTAEAYAALRSGTLDRRMDRHLTWRSLKLDEEGWGELMTVLMRAYDEAEEIEARSSNRRTASGEQAIPAICGLLGFERSALQG